MITQRKHLVWAVLITITAFMLILFQGCNLLKKRYPKTFSKEYTFSSENYKKLSVENQNGNVSIRKSDKEGIIIIKAEITKNLTKKELEQPVEEIMLNIDTTGNTIYISDESPKPGKGFNFKVDFGTETEFTIYVPADISIEIEGTNGKVDLRDFSNDVTAELTNGNIKAKNIYGTLKFTLTNGNITTELDSTKGINFETTNGSIKLEVGSNFSGNFDLSTRNGKIDYRDLDFKNVSEKKKEVKGTLGSGDTEVKIETTNGKITIDKK